MFRYVQVCSGMFQFLVRKISENKKEKDNGSYFVVQCLSYSSNIEFLKNNAFANKFTPMKFHTS